MLPWEFRAVLLFDCFYWVWISSVVCRYIGMLVCWYIYHSIVLSLCQHYFSLFCVITSRISWKDSLYLLFWGNSLFFLQSDCL